MKTIYIAHPINGDVNGNVEKILAICARIHSKNIAPIVPYLIYLRYLDDDDQIDRRLGMDASNECFRRKFIDEVWLFGDKISQGMAEEIKLAKKYNIPIIAKTEATKHDLENSI